MQSLNPQNLTINFPIIAAPKRTINGFRIEDSWFSCVRRLKDKDNFCTKEDRYPLSAIDKVLDFIFLEEELEESELISLIGKEQIEKEANVKMLNSLLKDIEEKRKKIYEEFTKT